MKKYFIGKHLGDNVDLFERARALMFYRFVLTFSLLFLLPVFTDVAMGWNKVLIKHLTDLAVIFLLLYFLRKFKVLDTSIIFFFSYALISYLLAFMMLNPVKLDSVSIVWSAFFLTIGALLLRGWTRILYCCFLGWVPIIYVLLNAQLNGLLTVHAITESIPGEAPVFLNFIPILLTVTAIWSHMNTIREARTIITEQKLLLTEKNKSILDSINYAQRIQHAKLPDLSQFETFFPESFILYRPKDIVSGDFYFFRDNGNTVSVAAADCTGHGVPGALMSMICTEKLEEALSVSDHPPEVLKNVNIRVKQSLRQSEEEETGRDGMDIALCTIDRANRTVKFSGANRPLWIIRKGMDSIEEIKATKCSIAGHTHDNMVFDSHEIRLQPGDLLYLFTDGYADQFHGKTGKKMMTKQFKLTLLSIRSLPMQEQGKYLGNFFGEWMGGAEQVDDVLVIGIRL
ncbi:MAG: SpoIIE family protein phosphatase [Bacteroidia bacterium]|nr:SpoIIE family protein phosphatase [Bacteroidia bacterium]